MSIKKAPDPPEPEHAPNATHISERMDGLDRGDAADRPLLLVDVDGVISLFGFDAGRCPSGHWQMVDGVAHFLSGTAGAHLRRLSHAYDLAWCTGWEDKANEYLPLALGLDHHLPHLSFADAIPQVGGHWKLRAIDRYAGADRPLAWIDDAHEERCHTWARERPGPTLLVTTDPAIGLTEAHVSRLLEWASALAGHDREDGRQSQSDGRPRRPGVA